MSSSETLDFLNAAKRFCSFMETSGDTLQAKFISQVQKYLLSLYTTALDFQPVFYDMEFEAEVNIEDMDIRLMTGDKLHNIRHYKHFNPIDYDDNEPIYGDLADDLSDIYKDLKSALYLYDSDRHNAKEYALWEMKNNFEMHWGNHCINALYAIHYIKSPF